MSLTLTYTYTRDPSRPPLSERQFRRCGHNVLVVGRRLWNVQSRTHDAQLGGAADRKLRR